MVRLHSLHFPTLFRQGETTFKSWSSDNPEKSTTIYKLDWTRIDQIKKDLFDDTKKTSNEVFPGTLPNPYDPWVKNLQFTIPGQYLDEIRRCSRMAIIEWNTERHFDTMICDICLAPADAYAYVAFRLLADCLFDPEANYFYRGDNKVIVPQTLLYKFWSFQTGRGLIKDHARFDKITYMIDEPVGTVDQKTVSVVRNFIGTIKTYEEKLEEIYKNQRPKIAGAVI